MCHFSHDPNKQFPSEFMALSSSFKSSSWSSFCKSHLDWNLRGCRYLVIDKLLHKVFSDSQSDSVRISPTAPPSCPNMVNILVNLSENNALILMMQVYLSCWYLWVSTRGDLAEVWMWMLLTPPPDLRCADSGYKWHHQHKMTTLQFRIFWLNFCAVGGSGDASFIFL